MRAILVAPFILALVLAGCLDPAPGTGTAQPIGGPPDETGLRGSSGAPGNVTAFEELFKALPAGSEAESDWTLLTMVAGPERPLAAFRLPVGGLVGYEDPDGVWLVDMEIAFLAKEGELDRLRQVIVQVFAEQGGALDGVASFSRGVWHEAYRSDTGVSRIDYEPPWDPAYFHGRFYPAQVLEPGDDMYVVLGAQASEPTEIAAAVRFVRSNDDWDALNAETMTGFDSLRSRAEVPWPLLPERMGNATGFHYPVYVDVNYAYLDPTYTLYEGYEGWTDDVSFTEELPATDRRPTGGARWVSVGYEQEAERGWSYSLGLYFNTLGAGLWTADYDLHGATGVTQVPATAYAPALAAYSLASMTGDPTFSELAAAYEGQTGLYWFEVQAEGEGGSRARMGVASASATAVVDDTLLVGLDLDATLEDLFGIPTRTYNNVYP